jgi:hypothetical protein
LISSCARFSLILFEEFYLQSMANLNDEDKYTAGRRDEQLRQQDDSGVQGMLIGVLVVLGVCGIAAAIFFSTRRDEAPVAPVVVPTASPASPQVNQNRETIIREKSTELVPVPVSPAAQPNVNITIPSTQPQPAQSSAQPSSEASTSPAPAASPSSSPSATESIPANSSP